MAVARVKLTGFKLIEIPDDIANSEDDRDIDKFIADKAKEYDISDFDGKVEFEDWW